MQIQQVSDDHRKHDPLRKGLADGWWVFLILIVSFSVGLALHLHLGIRVPLGADGPEYLGIAESLARGEGFKDPTGPWPDQPTTNRMPAWPVLLAPVMWLTPQPLHAVAARVAALLCLPAAGVLFYFLCRHLRVNRNLAGVSGLFAACSLPMIALAYASMSEGCAVLFSVAGIWLVLRAGSWPYLGAVCLSIAVMARTNLILLPLLFGVLCLLHGSSRRALVRQWRQGLVVCVIFFSLPIVWMARNYAITGRGLLLTTVEGETLYGGNNSVVANQLEMWGYWIVPDQPLGEPTKRELALTRREIEVDDYYHGKAIAWMKANRSQLPRLWLGKLVRSFVPVPWRPQAASYLSFGYRAILDFLFVLLIPKWRRRMDPRYILIFGAFSLATLATTLVYWGVYRFAHCFVELLFVPFIAVGLAPEPPNRAPAVVLISSEDGISSRLPD